MGWHGVQVWSCGGDRRKNVCVVWVCICMVEMCTLNREPPDVSKAIQKGWGVTRLEWSPLYPLPLLSPHLSWQRS